jgi:chorismate mutase / prephenate dehydratase
MSIDPPSLEDLRRRIDQLDDAMHDLLIDRAAVVEAIGRLKQTEGASPLRPGREAQILRRLVMRHRGPFSRAILVSIWRELLSGTTAMQGELQVAVFAPGNAAGLWDLARDHYGSHTPMTGFRSANEVVGAVSAGRASLGIVPVPGQDAGEVWWRLLIPGGETPKPRILARLPFGARGNARSGSGDAFVIGALEPEPSGLDRSLYIVETTNDLSRMRVTAAFGAAGLPATVLATTVLADGSAAQLLEFDGWILPGDPRLKAALASLGSAILRAAPLGFYAQPLTQAELSGVRM